MAVLSSMTGFGACAEGAAWAWELRSVNARGLEVRFRLPPGLDRLETDLRPLIASRMKRGTVHATLRRGVADSGGYAVDRTLLGQLTLVADEWGAQRPGSPAPRIELLMALPGVVRRDVPDTAAEPDEACISAMRAGFENALHMLVQARVAEGARLVAIILAQLESLAMLHIDAAAQAALQVVAQKAQLEASVRSLIADAPTIPAERLAQELALLASRADVTEEIDRLSSHIAAARSLLSTGGPQGRQLDFLVQEFMREANTLCSKSASVALTGVGLQMKAVIEQIREQVQNIE
jgi:uncharacterized protein (TIGR00255 family)